jgi:hypothetical protein
VDDLKNGLPGNLDVETARVVLSVMVLASFAVPLCRQSCVLSYPHPARGGLPSKVVLLFLAGTWIESKNRLPSRLRMISVWRRTAKGRLKFRDGDRSIEDNDDRRTLHSSTLHILKSVAFWAVAPCWSSKTDVSEEYIASISG